MNRKKILVLIMSLVMAVGMTMVFTACGDEETQGEDVTAEESEDAATDETQAAAVEEYIALAGEYQDEVSQRASATVIANTESQNVNITVMWSGSATTAAMWTMRRP